MQRLPSAMPYSDKGEYAGEPTAPADVRPMALQRIESKALSLGSPLAYAPFLSGSRRRHRLLICARSRRMVRRMPRVQVYLPEDLHEQLKQRDLPASELLQVALRAELERQDALAETDRYLEELAAEVGEPSQRQQATAEAIARRIRDRSLDRVG